LEEFYHREAFGSLPHYSNLKILANELPFATNANMMFDEKTLEPMCGVGTKQEVRLHLK
jgi:DNA mismatch repair protein MutS2